jgi:hypothetical protein
MSSPNISARLRPATSTRSWRHSNRTATPASPRAADTRIVAPNLRDFYEWLLSNDGGIPLEHCAVIDDKRACALEFNVVRGGKTELPPTAGVAVYARSQSGKLAAARIYDDVSPPLERRM